MCWLHQKVPWGPHYPSTAASGLGVLPKASSLPVGFSGARSNEKPREAPRLGRIYWWYLCVYPSPSTFPVLPNVACNKGHPDKVLKG